jgi:hypothetical protein
MLSRSSPTVTPSFGSIFEASSQKTHPHRATASATATPTPIVSATTCVQDAGNAHGHCDGTVDVCVD